MEVRPGQGKNVSDSGSYESPPRTRNNWVWARVNGIAGLNDNVATLTLVCPQSDPGLQNESV